MPGQGITRYGYRDAISGFFEFPTENARRVLPRGFEPVEVHHGTSILAVTVFDFDESEVGQYDEVVYAVIVPPLVRDTRLPKSAFFPWQVATSTKAAREHAIERWHLPHYMKAIDIDLSSKGDRMEVLVADAGRPVLEMTVTSHEFEPVRHLYNSFMIDGNDRYKVNIYMEGPHAEHEEERGTLVLHEHEMTSGLTINDVSTYAFREQWMGTGMQTFEEMERI